MRTALLGLGLILAAGCTARQAPHYSVAMGDLTMDQQDKVAFAIDAWRTACDQYGLTFVVVAKCGGAAHCMEFTPGLASSPYGGFTSYDGQSDSATVWLRWDAFQKSVTHEIGHAMGLTHTGPGTVMCASTDCASDAITSTDISQFASKH